MAGKEEKTASGPGGETSFAFHGRWPTQVASGRHKWPTECQLIFPEHPNDAALNFDIVRWNDDRGHFGVCGLQPDLSGALAVEALEGGFVAAYQRNHDVARIGHLSLLAHHEVA